MRKILISLFLIVSTISFSWDYGKNFRYDLERNTQILIERAISNNSEERLVLFSMVDNDYLTINLIGDYKMGSVFDIKIYVDEEIVETVEMVAINEKNIQGTANKKIVNSFKNGNTAILAYGHSLGSSVIKVNLNGFSNGFKKIKNIKYYH